MLSEAKARPVQWTDRTLSVLRASRLDACEKELAGLSGHGLFDAEATDLDAERLFEMSWMAEENEPPGLHTLEGLRTRVLGSFPVEMMLLSQEEYDLVLKTAFFGGDMPLFDWNDLIPARALTRRLWCRVETGKGNSRIIMPRQLCAGVVLMQISEEAGRIRETVSEITETVDNTLYLAGMMPAETVVRDLARQLSGTMAADRPDLYRRLLKASFETAPDREGRLTLIHPGLADPQSFLLGRKELSLGTDQDTMEDLYDSLSDVEDPLYDRMLGLIRDLSRPEAGAEDTVEDLILLAKQGAPVNQMREVLSSRIICLPTAEMVSVLTEFHDRVPKWFSLNMARVQ